MNEYVEPEGINYSCSKEIDSYELSKNLLLIVSFLKQINPFTELHQYNDWWEQDGCHFSDGKTDFEELLEMITQNNLQMCFILSDFNVFIGIAPKDNSWYLRFYLDEEENLGRFDITLPDEMAEVFEKEVLNKLTLEMKKQSAETYYNSIIC